MNLPWRQDFMRNGASTTAAADLFRPLRPALREKLMAGTNVRFLEHFFHFGHPTPATAEFCRNGYQPPQGGRK